MPIAPIVAAALAMLAQPAPRPPTPSPRQLAWHEVELSAFVHFTTNTFTDREWGYGDEDPAVFDPSDFDADQIVGTLADAGFGGVILTCKHHDGFCLWPTATTDHDIAASPWKDGEGDVVRAFADACAEHGVRFGVYLSPWDRHDGDYGSPAYVERYREQLRELLTGYGPIYEVWWDGANGGDGFYAGARETRVIDRSTYYGWDETISLVRELQPDACIFSDAGPDIRWVGNERGIAGDPCWATYTPTPRDDETVAGPGTTRWWEGPTGHRDGRFWIPAEADVSIRPGWFYHEAENDRVKTPEQLVDLYYASVGRGAALLLNVPPDRRGLIHEADCASLAGFRTILDETFGTDLTADAVVSADSTLGTDYGATMAADGDRETFWAARDDARTAELILDLPEPRWLNVVSIREHLPLGQRIDAWALDARRDGAWVQIGEGTSIGPRRLWRGDFVRTDGVRLRITAAAASPVIEEISLHAEPPRVAIDAPSDFIERATVTLTPDRPDAEVRYTLDGSEPGPRSRRYEGPFTVDRSLTIRAVAVLDGRPSPFETARSIAAHDGASLRDPIVFVRAPDPGLRCRVYEGDRRSLDGLDDSSPDLTTVVPSIDLAPRTRPERVALVFDGVIAAPADGLYRFHLASDDGSRLYIGDDLVVDNDGLHAMAERSGVVGLRAGFHPIRLEYFNATGDAGLRVEWSGPGFGREPVGGAVLRH